MAEMTKPVQNNNDEIDLIKVLERISNFLSSNKLMLIIGTLTGILCGLAIYLLQPKIFGSTLILHSQVLSNAEEIEIIENWNNLRREGEYAVLSRNLNCPVDLLKKVKGITAANIQINQPTSGFTVEVYVTDTAVLEELQKAIIYGLENNEFVKEKVDLKRSNTIKIIDNINLEIAKLDSTKKKIESGNNVGKLSGSSSLIMNISDVNVQMITLNEKLYQYQDILKFVNAIQILQNFEKFTKPVSPRLPKMILSGLLGGLFVGFALSALKSIRLKIAMISRSPQN